MNDSARSNRLVPLSIRQRLLTLPVLWLSLAAGCSSGGTNSNGTGGASGNGGSGVSTGGAAQSTGGLTTSTGGQPASNGGSGTVSGGAASGGAAPAGGSNSLAGAGTTSLGGAIAGGGSTTTGGATAGGGTSSTGGKSQGGGGASSTGGTSQGGGGASSTGGKSQGGGGGAAAQGGSAGKGGTGGAAQAGAGGNAGAAGSAGAASYSPCPPAGQPCKILPFGDSITDGYIVGGGYRIELFRSARAASKSITFVGSLQNGPTQVDGVTFPRNHEGHSAFTIDPEPQASRNGLSPLTEDAMSDYKPHIVTLMIGTNDVDLSIDLATAHERVGALMDRVLAADPNVLLVLAQIIPSKRDDLNTRVRAYNATLPALVTARVNAGKHVLLVDMYGAFTRDADYKTALLIDDLHPNAAGFARMAQTWYQALEGVLH